MQPAENEDAIWETIAAESERRRQMAVTGTPEQAIRVGQLHNQFPSLAPGVKLAAAKANLTDEQVKQIALAAARVDVQPKEPKKKSWIDRNVTDKIKTASRYGMAGLEFVPQLTVGAVAQVFDDDEDVNGWFISTDLGSLIANDEDAGEGFFIGGKAKELQSERARRYRGTINGEAFTIGRGLASTFLEENTNAYRLLSGAVDAAVAIAIPSIPLAGAVGKAARAVEEGADVSKGFGLVGKGLSVVSQTDAGADVVSKVGAASRLVGRGSKEVTVTAANAAERAALRANVGIVGNSIDLEQSNRFFRTGFGRRLIERTAETNDFAETHKLWGGKLDPATTMRLANAKTDEEVMATVLDVLGTQVTNIAGVGGGRRTYMSLAQRNKIIDLAPFGEGVSRTFAKMPSHNINLFQAETPRDQIRQLDTVERTLKLFKVEPAKQASYINRAGELLLSKDTAKIAEFYDDLLFEAKDSMKFFGTPEEIVDELYKVHGDYVEGAKANTLDKLGNKTDDGLYRLLHGLPPDADARIYLGGTLTSEFGKHEFIIPDPRQVRRLTNNFNWLWVKKDPNIENLQKAGDLRFPLAAAQFIQEQVWRKYITATIGNFVRNTVDSQISLALSGKTNTSAFYHPFQWMSYVKHEVGQGTLTGKNWDIPGSVENLDESLLDYRNVLGSQISAYYKDPLVARQRAAKINQFARYERRLDQVDNAVARAHGDEIGKLNADWATRRMAEGKSVDELFDLIQTGDEDAVKWFKQVEQEFKRGKEIWDNPTQTHRFEKIDLNVPGNLKRLMEANGARLQKITGNHPELLDIVAQGRLTKGVELVKLGDEIVGELRVGGRVEVTQEVMAFGKKVKQTYLARVVDETKYPKGSEYLVEPFAFDGAGNITNKLESVLRSQNIYMDPRMPRYVVGEIRDPQTLSKESFGKAMDMMVDKFHSTLYTEPIAKLERSPAFRSFYYERIEKLAQSLDEASLNKIIDDITSRIDDPENYLTPQVWNKLQDLKANPDKLYGTLNADEVSTWASAAAVDDYKKTFYNAVERRNGTDVMRLISPFAQQQAEFFGRMSRFFTVPVAGGALGYLPNPDNFRKVQFAVENGREADPDGDGRGIFYKDPSTGKYSMSIPLTGYLTKMVTGINADFSFGVKGIAPGFDYRPGLGPVMTMTTSAILKNVPEQDFIRKTLLPYGERTNFGDTFIPTWVTKVYEGLTGNTDGRFFANTYAETMQALAATGKYDLSNVNDKARLEDDSKDKARFFAILRGIVQFTGPAAGDFDFSVAVKDGMDVHTAGLATALQALRENNPDTSALRFIEIFGENAFIYLSNKTTTDMGGLGASKEFGNFERSNSSLFRKYKDIAGFFGPSGTDFDFEVYTRQLATGARTRLTPEEIIDASQKAIGMAFYRDMKSEFGPKLNQPQRDYLANYKKAIIAKYPGFGKMNLDPNKTSRDINSLFEAAKTDGLQGNGVAQAVNYYEQIRNQALAEANRRGYDSLAHDALSDLHEYLYSYAETLTEQTPDFGKVYDRLLSQEME
jgi:catechol 2,3-dioxygenase-like lactoylglutathione lyase family enzyme